MNDSRTESSSVSDPVDNLSIEAQLRSLSIQTSNDNVYQSADLGEASSKQQVQNVIGQHVSKRFAELMCEGFVESHDNVSEMFKVVYTNGNSEEMRWEDLMNYLVPLEQPFPPDVNVLANNASRNNKTGKALALVAPSPSARKRGHTKKMSSGTKRKKGANNVCPPRQAGRRGPQRSAMDGETFDMVLRHSARKRGTSEVMNLRRSTRRRKELGYSYCEETTDEDEYEDENEPDYPLPPVIQVPWADMEEDPGDIPIKGLCTSKGHKGRAKKNWASLRICASSYPSKPK